MRELDEVPTIESREIIYTYVEKEYTIVEPQIVDGLEMWIMQHSHSEFEWGWNDCNTIVVEYVDWLTGSNIMNEVRGKYYDLKTAHRFAKNYKQLHVGLQDAGFVEVDTPQDGDVITMVDRGLVCGHIVFNNRAHSMDMLSGYISVPLNIINLNDNNLKIWRHNG